VPGEPVDRFASAVSRRGELLLTIKRRHAAVAGAMLTALLFQGTTLAAEPERITQPIQATRADLDPQRTYAAPSLAVHPDNPQLIVGGTLEFRQKQCQLIRSTDGGTTWRFVENPPVLNSFPYCLHNNSNAFQAPVAWGRGNNLYMLSVGWDEQDTRSKVSIVLHRSTDAGDSWSSTVVRDARATERDGINENNRPVTDIAVDTRGSQDIVYVSYRRGYSGTTSGNGRPSMPMVAVSTDSGQTFSEPVPVIADQFEQAATRDGAIRSTTTVANATTTTAVPGSLASQPNQAANFGGGNPSITLDDRGNVYAAWKSAYSNISPAPPAGIFLSRSTDRGATWTVTQIRPFGYQNGSAFIIPQVEWTRGGGPDGTLHVVYDGSDRPETNSYSTIYYTRSTDNGQTWSDPVRLPDVDEAELVGQYIANLSAAPNGRLDVAWWDTRDDPGIRSNDVYYTYSTDGGRTWARNIRVSDQTIDRRFGVWGNNFDQNSPPGLASVNQYAIFGWDDTRFSRGEGGPVLAEDPVAAGVGVGGGVQDIFVSTVQFAAVGGGASSAAKAVLAGVVGLVAVGLVLLLVTMSSRRKDGPARPRRAAEPKSEAPVG
jgi:hypothetical protein